MSRQFSSDSRLVCLRTTPLTSLLRRCADMISKVGRMCNKWKSAIVAPCTIPTAD